jgi:hypothetical protein
MDDQHNDPTESELNDVEKLLSKVSKKNPNIRKPYKPKSLKEKEKLGKSIASILSEYTDCYILLGFDTNGNAMVLINSANNLESRALSNLVQDFLVTDNESDGNMEFDEDM